MKSNFLKRAITGVLFVVVLVGCILYSPLSFGILFTIIGALSVHEFAHLINQNGEVQINKTITALGGAYLFLAVMGFCQSTIGAQVFLPYLALLLYLIITELYLKKKNPIGNWAFSMLSQLYVALPFALLNVLAFQYNSAESSVTYNPILPLSIFVFIWLSDTSKEKLNGICAMYPNDTSSDWRITSSPEYGKKSRMTSGATPNKPVIHGKRL